MKGILGKEKGMFLFLNGKVRFHTLGDNYGRSRLNPLAHILSYTKCR